MNPNDTQFNPLDLHTLDQKSWSFQDIIGQRQGRFPGALRDFISVKDFGAVGDGVTDDTAAISAAIDFCDPGGPELYVPKGTYLVTSQLTALTGQFSIRGDGSQQTAFLHNPIADGDCFKLSNGAAQCTHGKIIGLSVRTTDTTHTKNAFRVQDGSVCHFEDVYVYGNGTGVAGSPAAGLYYSGGTGSTALLIEGREKITVSHYVFIADYPVRIGANPNSAATNNEDCDTCTFYDGYVLASGHKAFTVADGHGVQNLNIVDHNFVGGTGLININDTRASPVVPTHDITIRNSRAEQCTDPNSYWADIAFVANGAPGAITFDHLFVDSTAQGMSITKSGRLTVLDSTLAIANAKNAVLYTPYAIDSTVTWLNSYASPGSVVTFTDMLVSWIGSWDSTLSQTPTNVIWTYKTAAYRTYWSAAPNTQTGATYTVLPVDTDIIANRAGTVTLTLETASGVPGKRVTVRTIQAQTVVSAASNVVPLVGGAAGTAILAATAGKWAQLVSDGTNWQIQAAN